MKGEQIHVRVPSFTIETADLIGQAYGMSRGQVITLAIDRLAFQAHPELNPEIRKELEEWRAANPPVGGDGIRLTPARISS